MKIFLENINIDSNQFRINGHQSECLPGLLNISFLGVDAESLLLEIPEVEKTPAEICDEKAEIAKAFFAKNYSDASYNSHKYVEYLIGYPTPSLEAVCQMNFNTPANKSFNCVGNNTYAQNIGNSMNGIGFDLAEPVYFGTCS